MSVVQDVSEVRVGLYRLLAALYRYPLRQETLDALAEAYWQEQSPLDRSLRDLQLALNKLEPATREVRLNIEMTRLMEGPGLTAAPPYASYYLNGKRLMGPAAQAATRAYLEWQAVPDKPSIPPDHISVEFGFMAYLAEQAAQMDTREASFTFLQKNLRPWLSLFCANLEASSREPFFSALARVTRQVVEADETWLEESLLLEPIDSRDRCVNN